MCSSLWRHLAIRVNVQPNLWQGHKMVGRSSIRYQLHEWLFFFLSLCRFICDNCLKKSGKTRKDNKFSAKRTSSFPLPGYKPRLKVAIRSWNHNKALSPPLFRYKAEWWGWRNVTAFKFIDQPMDARTDHPWYQTYSFNIGCIVFGYIYFVFKHWSKTDNLGFWWGTMVELSSWAIY